MGGGKGSTKSGGFFHMLDWNRKSRKKLFSSGSVSPESTKQGRRSADNLATSRFRLVDEDEFGGVSSRKGSSDYSCASSVTDEEGASHRAPGVVARLMGLDSMPTSGISEPSSTPSFDTRSLPDSQSHKRSPESCIDHQFNRIVHRAKNYSNRPMELRSQRMPSSPIERFQTETLPPRSAKPLSVTHHKLLSPIKNPGFICAKNAAHIMEAAAKILDTGNHSSNRTKVSSFASSSTPLRVCNVKESIAVPHSQRTSRTLESARTPVDSTDVRYLRGQPLSRSWNGSEDDTASSRRTPYASDSNQLDVKGNGKSISLAVQAKVNVQRREGLSSSSRNIILQKEQDECKLNQPFKSQSSSQKNKQQKNPSKINGSGVLRQNNQKQNCVLNKGKLSSKQSISNQHGRKVLLGDASSTKNKTLNKISRNSRISNRKESAESNKFEREELSASNKDFPRKKRLVEGGFISEKTGSIDNVLVVRHEKCVQSNVVIDEHSCSSWMEDNRSGADVVSFTFTSPLVKPVPASGFSSRSVKDSDNGNIYCFDTHSQKNEEEKKDKSLSYHGLNLMSGDALSLLLEQKLRELTSRVVPLSDNVPEAGSFMASSFISQAPISDSGTGTPTVDQREEVQHRDKPRGVFGYGVSSIDGQVYGERKLQDAEECSSISDARNGLDHQHLSPFSILESSFSNESCSSTGSSASTDGIKACSSSILAQDNVSSSTHEADIELSDSASSTLTEVEISDSVELSKESPTNTRDQDLDYVSEVLSSNEDSCLGGEKLKPLLFNKLEDKRRGEDKDVDKLRRRVLFDCVNECMDLRSRRYFQAGYNAWCKGVALMRKENLAREIYEEISEWKSMGDWMVDELVDSDMSSHLGRWVDYEIESFEAALETQRGIMSSLITEVVTDFFNKGPCLY